MNELLYKYKDVSKYTLEIFINKEIYFPVSSLFNDPFDSQLLPSSFVQELKDLGYLLESDRLSSHEPYVKERLLNYGIYSLSKKNDDILMWSHYAKSHTGICIGFSEKITHHFSDYDWPFWVYDVVYEVDHPFKKILEDFNTRTRFNSGNKFLDHCQLSQALLDAALTVKHENWQYEHEVRVISEVNGVQGILPSAIETVVLGLNISNSDEHTIRSILSNSEWNHVRLYRAVRGKAALKLDIVEA